LLKSLLGFDAREIDFSFDIIGGEHVKVPLTHVTTQASCD
jgi:hypothetical protein